MKWNGDDEDDVSHLKQSLDTLGVSVTGGEHDGGVAELVDLVRPDLSHGEQLRQAVGLARPGRPVERRVARGVSLVDRHTVDQTLPQQLDIAALCCVVERARVAVTHGVLHHVAGDQTLLALAPIQIQS